MGVGSPGPDWWMASDGNWYPPEATPGTPPPAVPEQVPPATPPSVPVPSTTPMTDSSPTSTGVTESGPPSATQPISRWGAPAWSETSNGAKLPDHGGARPPKGPSFTMKPDHSPNSSLGGGASFNRPKVLMGLVLVVIGIGVTVVTYSTASSAGGTYFVAYGPVIWGVITMFRGFFES